MDPAGDGASPGLRGVTARVDDRHSASEAKSSNVLKNPPKSGLRSTAHGSICIQEGQPIDPINLFLLLLQDSVDCFVCLLYTSDAADE